MSVRRARVTTMASPTSASLPQSRCDHVGCFHPLCGREPAKGAPGDGSLRTRRRAELRARKRASPGADAATLPSSEMRHAAVHDKAAELNASCSSSTRAPLEAVQQLVASGTCEAVQQLVASGTCEAVQQLEAPGMSVCCRECKVYFVFGAEEQALFVANGWPIPRQRCEACTLRRKLSKRSKGAGHRAPAEGDGGAAQVGS